MWACLIPHKTTMLSDLIQVSIKALNNPKIKYVYQEEFKYNSKTAHSTIHNKPRLVFKNTRETYTKNKGTIRRTDSFTRTKSTIYDIINCNKSKTNYLPVFATFTYHENITAINDSNRNFRNFIRRLERYTSNKLLYITIIEFQKRGAIHYHSLFFNLPYVDKHIFEKMWGYGTTNIKGIKHVNNLSAYVSKYLTKKSYRKRLYGQKAYFTSRGLERSKIERHQPLINQLKLNYQEKLKLITKTKTFKTYELKTSN